MGRMLDVMDEVGVVTQSTTAPIHDEDEILAGLMWIPDTILNHMNQGLVHRCGRDDLHQVGLIAVMKAMRLYDPSRISRSGRTATLATYAYAAARHRMIDHVRSASGYRKRGGKDGEERRVSIYSLDTCGSRNREDDDSSFWHPADPSTTELRGIENVEEATRLMSYATKIDRQVIQMSVVDDLSFSEIGLLMGISRSRVCQRYSRGMFMIRTTARVMDRGRR